VDAPANPRRWFLFGVDVNRRRDELAERDDDREIPPVAYQAVPFQPTRTAISDELGRSMVKAGVALLPGLAVGGTLALVAVKIANALRDLVRRRRHGTEPEIDVRVFNHHRRVVDVGYVEVEEPEVVEVARPKLEAPKSKTGKSKDASAPPPPPPPRPIATATRRARYLRRRSNAGIE
jgi:hypothetical protein